MSFKNFVESVNSLKMEDVSRKAALKNDRLAERRYKSKKMHKITDWVKKTRTNVILSAIFFMLLTSAAGLMILHYIQQNTMEIQAMVTSDYLNSDAELIINTKNYIDAVSSSGLKDISRDITNEIYSSLDMDALEEEMNKGNVPEELERIFRRNILKKTTIAGLDYENNNIFICNDNGILADYSNVYASDVGTTRTWEVESSSQQNSELFNNSIQSMLHQDVSYLFVEENDVNTENHLSLNKMTTTDLVNIYKAEGLEGLKYYTFLVPVYVFENNDIFGVADIVDGHRVQNNRFIIVQRYNLYDYILTYNIDAEIGKDITFEFKHVYTLIFVLLIVYVMSTIVNIIYSVVMFNRAVAGPQVNAQPQKPFDPTKPIDPYQMTGRRVYDRYSIEILKMLQDERENEAKMKKESSDKV